MPKKLAKKKYTIPAVTGKVDIKVDGAEMVPLKDLNLWKDNPRYNVKAVPKLAKVFQIHGVRSALVVWKDNMTIYKGNTTFKALKLLGCTHAPVHFQDFDSEAAAKAYGIADNKSSEYSEWDDDVLINIMSAESMDTFRNKAGFAETEIERMIRKQAGNTVNIKESLNLPVCQIKFHPEIREGLKTYIQKTVARKFGDKVLIKF